MTDGPHPDDDPDLGPLKAAMDRARPRPDPAVRAAHLRLAQDNFARLHQETAVSPRPNSERPVGGVFTGVIAMLKSLSSRGALTATTALVAGGFILLTPVGETLLRGVGGQIDRPEPVVDLRPEPVPDSVPEPRTVTTDAAPEAAEVAVPDAGGPAVSSIAEAQAQEAAPLTDDLAIADAEAETDARSRTAAEIAPADADAGLAAVAPEPPVVAMPSPAFEPSPDMAAPMAAPMPGAVLGLVAPDMVAPTLPDTEAFATADDNPVRVVADEPVSTFSIDVDTASYAIVRQSLNAGQLPPRDAVRVEEIINYFPYDLPAPTAGGAPFQPTVSVFETPWNPDTQLVHIGIQGQLPAVEDRPPLNLVFLIDTSGSMDDPTKLPLLVRSFQMMLGELGPEDQVAIVTYAGSAGLALPPTAATETGIIMKALLNLRAGGSTNGQAGLEQAYDIAAGMTADGEVGRVILATDGDFNVGLSDPSELTDYIAGQRDSGIYLSVLGFGRGNLDDATMQALAQNGNGTASYIDTLTEAQKVLVDQLTGALFPIAGDVKVQVEFNPAVVAEYRLIGYETRALNREDFNNDRVDAGEIGAGHSVTAIYEITPVGSPAVLVDPLRYGAADAAEPASEVSTEVGFLRLRWKDPGADDSQLMEMPIVEGDRAPTSEAQFAAAMAGFGQLLRGTDALGDWGWDEAIALALEGRGEDPFGYRQEAIGLMRLAETLSQ